MQAARYIIYDFGGFGRPSRCRKQAATMAPGFYWTRSKTRPLQRGYAGYQYHITWHSIVHFLKAKAIDT